MGKIHVVCSSVLSYLTVRFHFVPGVWGTPQQASFVLPNDILAGTAPPSAALSVTAGSIIGSGNSAFLSLVSVPIGALQRVQPPMPPHPAPQSAQIGCLRLRSNDWKIPWVVRKGDRDGKTAFIAQRHQCGRDRVSQNTPHLFTVVQRMHRPDHDSTLSPITFTRYAMIPSGSSA